MKKILLIFTGIILVCAIVALKPKNVNVPPGHDTIGKLMPPDKVYPNWPPEQPYLTIENTSGCTLVTLKFWITANDESGNINTQPISIPVLGNNGVLTINDIRTALKLGTQPLDITQIISITNLSLDVQINGATLGYFLYPYPPNNAGTWITTGLSKPCDCLHVLFDKANNKVIISRPVPPCAP